MAAVRQWVNEAGPTMHAEKTRIVHVRAPGGFDFLGYHFEHGMRWPRQKSLEKLKQLLRTKTSRLDGRSLSGISWIGHQIKSLFLRKPGIGRPVARRRWSGQTRAIKAQGMGVHVGFGERDQTRLVWRSVRERNDRPGD